MAKKISLVSDFSDFDELLKQYRKSLEEPTASLFLLQRGIADMVRQAQESPLMHTMTDSAASINRLLEDTRKSLVKSQPQLNVLTSQFSGLLHRIEAYRLDAVTSLNFSILEAVKQASGRHSTGEAQLLAQLLGPSSAFAQLVENTELRIQETDNERTKAVLNSSVDLAEAQLVSSTGMLKEVVSSADFSADEEFDAEPELVTPNLPEVQQKELLTLSKELDESDILVLANGALSTRAANEAFAIGQLIAQCNNAMKLGEREPIFKLTERLLMGATRLPSISAVDETSLGNVVDDLYFILYEGAGRDNLRFLKAHGGPFEDSSVCGVIWNIKHLRNNWLRHDPDHGDASKIRKSRQNLKAALQAIGLTRMPIDAGDFQEIQNWLLRESRQFLERLLEGIARF